MKLRLLLSSILFGLILASGCTSIKPVLLPEPTNYTRPVLIQGFFDCLAIDASSGNVVPGPNVCLQLEDAQSIMAYLTDIEVELRKCAITVEELNKERKK